MSTLVEKIVGIERDRRQELIELLLAELAVLLRERRRGERLSEGNEQHDDPDGELFRMR